MATDQTLIDLENTIAKILERPEKEEDVGLTNVENTITEKRIFPIGPADATAFIDFHVHVLAADNTFAIPTGMHSFNEENCIMPLLSEAFNYLVDEFRRSYSERSIFTIALPGSNEELLCERMIETIVDNFNDDSIPLYQRIECLSESIKILYDLLVDEDSTFDIEKFGALAEKLDCLLDMQGYGFDIYQPDTINLGLRLIYRQEWEPQNYQTGELLNTIPLAPGEKIKYETKTWQTTKSVQEINESTTFSTEEILSTTQRDIVDIMKRASTKFNITTEAHGGANLGVYSAKASVSSSLTKENESKLTKQKFREAISKSTQQIKNERKVSINISTEVGTEEKITREISNPNDEITVTYLFYELQRVYKIKEYLYNLVPVVYVANYVPPANEIDDNWIIKYDWIIAGAILDKSFIDTIAFISQEMPGLKFKRDTAQKVFKESLSVVRTIKYEIATERRALEEATNAMQRGDLNWVEILQTIREIKETKKEITQIEKRLEPAQAALEKAEERFSQATFDYKQGRKRVDRLINHIRGNIIHYMHAIWDSEHPDQRYLRLNLIRYPHIELINCGQVDGVPANPEFDIIELYPLTEVVDTYNPLGYLGNYTIYRLLRDDNAVIGWMAQSYLKHDENVPGSSIVTDPDETDPDSEDAIMTITTPSDAVYIEALPGTRPLIEHFKLMHRSIDMDKAKQELIKQQLENLRRLELIKKGDLGDPEFEKTIVSDANGLLLNKIASLTKDNENKDEVQ